LKNRIRVADIPDVKQRIVLEQQGMCPLCGISLQKYIPKRDWCLDHDHKTGAIRGVLCRNCNGMEGKIYNRVMRASRGAEACTFLSRLYHYYKLHAVNCTGLIHPTHLTTEEKRVKKNAKARKLYKRKRK
jgi:hypothetical protein